MAWTANRQKLQTFQNTRKPCLAWDFSEGDEATF